MNKYFTGNNITSWIDWFLDKNVMCESVHIDAFSEDYKVQSLKNRLQLALKCFEDLIKECIKKELQNIYIPILSITLKDKKGCSRRFCNSQNREEIIDYILKEIRECEPPSLRLLKRENDNYIDRSVIEEYRVQIECNLTNIPEVISYYECNGINFSKRIQKYKKELDYTCYSRGISLFYFSEKDRK